MNHFSWRAWWSGQRRWYDQHPVAHLAGGAAVSGCGLLLFAGVWWRALLFTVLYQAMWELAQVEQFGDDADGDPLYSYESAALDVLASAVGAGAVLLLRALV